MKYKPKSDISAAIRYIREARRCDADGRISMAGSLSMDWLSFLSTAIFSEDEMSPWMKDSIIRSCIFSNRLPLNFDKDNLLDCLNFSEHKLRNTGVDRFYILFGISLRGDFPFRKLRYLGVDFDFSPAPSFVGRARSSWKSLGYNEETAGWTRESDYMPVRASVLAHHFHDAHHLARKAFDRIRALLSLYLDFGKEAIFKSGFSEAMGSVRLDRISTFHGVSGVLATEMFYYESDWRKMDKLRDIDSQSDQALVAVFRRKFSSLKPRSDYNDFVWKCLEQYARALDANDHQVSLVQMWLAFEKIARVERPDGEVVRRRIASYFPKSDRDLVHLIVDGIRINRNELVHSGEAFILNYMRMSYLGKRLVEYILALLVDNALGISNVDELTRFMEETRDEVALKKKARTIRLVQALEARRK